MLAVTESSRIMYALIICCCECGDYLASAVCAAKAHLYMTECLMDSFTHYTLSPKLQGEILMDSFIKKSLFSTQRLFYS